MTFLRLWLLLTSADWTVRVLTGVFLGGGLSLSTETGISLLLVPPLETAVLLGALRIGVSLRRRREAGP